MKVGEDIPTREEAKALVGALSGRWRPLLLTAVFAGLRSSELRGLSWQDVDLDRKEIHVRQRADEFGEIGSPKSEAGERTVPVPPIVVNALREWKLACPKSDLRLVFPNGAGKVESHANIVNRGLIPAMLAAGVAVDTGERDEEGKPVLAAKYTGLHALRNVERDAIASAKLRDAGWQVLVIWECWTRKPEGLADMIREFLESNEPGRGTRATREERQGQARADGL